MSGHNVFDVLMRELKDPTSRFYNGGKIKITPAEFDQWQKQLQFDLLKGLRYGQSFCNYFDIKDNILYYEFSWLNAEEYIRRAYIEKS